MKVDAWAAAEGWLVGFADRRNTRRSYVRVIGEWFAVPSAGVDPLDAGRPLVEAHKAALFDAGRKRSTVGQRLAVLASFTDTSSASAVAGGTRTGPRHARLGEKVFDSPRAATCTVGCARLAAALSRTNRRCTRTTRRDDRNGNKVDRHATYALAAYLAGGRA